jgi:hypothetical protein
MLDLKMLKIALRYQATDYYSRTFCIGNARVGICNTVSFLPRHKNTTLFDISNKKSNFVQ